MNKNEIDIDSFSKDLLYYKNKIFNVKENKISDSDDSLLDEINIDDNENIRNYSIEDSQEDPLDDIKKIKPNNKINIFDRIKGLFNSINYSQVYLRIKQSQNGEKYIIVFTDLFSNNKITDENVKNNLEVLNENKEIIFLLLGRKNNNENFEKNKLSDIICNKFSQKSQIINLGNTKKIKNILSNDIEIKDEFIYPNELYKY